MDKIAKELYIDTLDDWYKFTSKQIRQKAPFVGSKYKGSLLEALQNIYPDHNWDGLRFATVSRGYWQSVDNQRKLMDKIGEELGVKVLDDWYKVSTQEVLSRRASFVTNIYHGSLSNTLKQLYPEHPWNELKFENTRPNTWRNESNRKNALEKVGVELGVKKMEDWYNISVVDVQKKANFINRYYNGCLATALQQLYPEHPWDPFRFKVIPKNYWDNEDNQRKYFERIGKELGVTKLDDWYNVSQDVVRRNKGSFILNKYNGSVFAALQKLYPEHNWDPLRVSKAPRGFWQKESTKEHYHKLILKWYKKYNITELRDWYQLPPKQLKIFQRVAIGIFGGLTNMLNEWFPDTNWSNEVLSSSPELQLQVDTSNFSEILNISSGCCG